MAKQFFSKTRAIGSGKMISHGNTPIPVDWYEVQRCDSDLRGRSWWNTIHSVKSEKKAFEIAKRYEAQGRRIRIWKKGTPHHLVSVK